MQRLRPRRLLAWSGLGISLVFAYFAVRNVDLAEFRRTLARSDYVLLGAALVVLAAGIYLRVLRWQVLFVRRPRPPLSAVSIALLVGYLFNSILPARAGEAARVVVLNQLARTSRFEALGTVVAERVLDVLVLLGLLVAIGPFVPESSWMTAAVSVGGAAFLALAILLTAAAFRGGRPVAFLLRPLALLPGVSSADTARGAANLVVGLAVFRHPLVAFRAVALTAISWLVISFSFWLCMRSVDLDTGMAAAILVVIAVNLAMILPSGPGGLGVFEAATVLTLSHFGVDRSQALSYAVLTHAVNLLPLVAGGYVALHLHTRAVRGQQAVGAESVEAPFGSPTDRSRVGAQSLHREFVAEPAEQAIRDPEHRNGER